MVAYTQFCIGTNGCIVEHTAVHAHAVVVRPDWTDFLMEHVQCFLAHHLIKVLESFWPIHQQHACWQLRYLSQEFFVTEVHLSTLSRYSRLCWKLVARMLEKEYRWKRYSTTRFAPILPTHQARIYYNKSQSQAIHINPVPSCGSRDSSQRVTQSIRKPRWHIHIHIHTHTQTRARTHTHTHAHTHACTRTHTHTHTHKFMCVYLWVSIYASIVIR